MILYEIDVGWSPFGSFYARKQEDLVELADKIQREYYNYGYTPSLEELAERSRKIRKTNFSEERPLTKIKQLQKGYFHYDIGGFVSCKDTRRILTISNDFEIGILMESIPFFDYFKKDLAKQKDNLVKSIFPLLCPQGPFLYYVPEDIKEAILNFNLDVAFEEEAAREIEIENNQLEDVSLIPKPTRKEEVYLGRDVDLSTRNCVN